MLSVIIPASNEAEWIARCLKAVFASQGLSGSSVEVIVVANGCRDQTAHIARSLTVPLGWRYQVVQTDKGSKTHALNLGEQVAWPLRAESVRVYLDADCVIGPHVLTQLQAALRGPEADYASATVQITTPRSFVSRQYARFWQKLPFVQEVAPGFGLYAVNRRGRTRWGQFPDLISDDSFVRLHFQADQRRQVADTYSWPLVEGWQALVRTRRRQDGGLRELRRKYPQLFPLGADNSPRPSLFPLALRDPLGSSIYCMVRLVGRLRRSNGEFTRGRL